MLPDGSKHPIPVCVEAGGCEQCGFSMAGEMDAVFHFCPETILAGLELRVDK